VNDREIVQSSPPPPATFRSPDHAFSSSGCRVHFVCLDYHCWLLFSRYFLNWRDCCILYKVRDKISFDHAYETAVLDTDHEGAKPLKCPTVACETSCPGDHLWAKLWLLFVAFELKVRQEI